MGDRNVAIEKIQRWCKYASRVSMFFVVVSLIKTWDEVTQVLGEATSLSSEVLITVVCHILYGGILAIALFYTYLFLKKIAQSSTPFQPIFIKRLKTLSTLLFALVAVHLCSQIPYYLDLPTELQAGSFAYGLGRIIGLITAYIVNVLMTYGIPAFAMLILSKILEYGCILQKQDDELL